MGLKTSCMLKIWRAREQRLERFWRLVAVQKLKEDKDQGAIKHRPSDRKQDTCSYSEGRLIAGQLVTSCSTPPTVSDTSSLKAMFALMQQEVTQKRAPGINPPLPKRTRVIVPTCSATCFMCGNTNASCSPLTVLLHSYITCLTDGWV